MKLSKSQAGLLVLLFVLLLAGTVSALPGDDRTMRDPPSVQAGERVPVFLVFNEQPQHLTSFGELKANALSRQAQVLQTVSTVDSAAAKTARSYWIANAVWIEADPATLDKLAAIPGVDHIEPDLTVTLNDPVAEVSSTIGADSISQPESEYAAIWNVDFIEAPSVWKNGTTGEGVKIAIVDTGIQGDHPAFGDRIVAFADFVNGENETPYDDYGHGTHCAGTAAGGTVTVDTEYGRLDVALGVAPGADLMGAKVLDHTGSGSISSILAGIQWAVEREADVISMSLGVSPIYRNVNDEHHYLYEGESDILELDLSSEPFAEGSDLYEPKFVIGSVRIEDPYYVAMGMEDFSPVDLLQNLTIAVTDARDIAANGAEVDWLGFDHQANCYYFKAPYAANTAGWNGIWKINVTNTGATAIRIEEIALVEHYQSGGETRLDAAVNNAVNTGVVVAVSAGNNGDYGASTVGSPGTAKDAITVGATDYLMDYRAYFSSMGPVNRTTPYIKPDVMAPGVGIISAYPEGQYASMQGTSMACPAVAGAAALMLSGNETLTPADVKAALMETAVHIGEDGAIQATMQPNNAYGAGRINAYEAVNTTGGLGTALPWDGIRHELIGGILTSYSLTGDTLPIMAVLWNTTAGEPIADEEVAISVWYGWGDDSVPLEDLNLTTDAGGYVYYNASVSDVPNGNYVYVRIAHGNLQLEDSVWRYSVTPTPTTTPGPAVPLFESVSYSVDQDAVVEIKYPLLNADGSPYAESVAFVVRNWSGEIVASEVLPPADGVISYSLDLAGRSLDETPYNIWINNRSAGYVYVGAEEYPFQEVSAFPERAICPPGETVDLGIKAFPQHGAKTVSQQFDVYVTTLTETEVLSLSSAGALALPALDEAGMQALRVEIDAMKPETYAGTVTLTNGIGLLNFTMPEGGYIAIVRFISPYEYGPMALSPGEEITVLVYGTLEPWLMHRSTPPISEDLYDRDLTYISSAYDWPATWDQDAYVSVPAGEATITAYVYTYNQTTGEPGYTPGQTVYLYTENGVDTAVIDAAGACTFTVNTDGKERLDYLLMTDGLSGTNWIWYWCPLDQVSRSPVNPGMLTSSPWAPASFGMLSPDSETRSVSIARDGDAYNVIPRSYGPDDEPIDEVGYFRFDRVSKNSMWNYAGTEAAAVVDFTGTETKRVTTSAEGNYGASYGLLDPNTQTISRNLYATLRNPERSISYTLPESVFVETSVPVVFNASTRDGTPIDGARVVLALGASAYRDEFSIDGDPRNANILLAGDDYPDPYTVVATGYTDASGKATLTFTAPNAGQQALREALAHESGLPYMVLCYHDGELVQEDYGYMGVTTALLPDFVPDISAPQIVKLERNDTITISNVALLISNIGTADYVFDEANKMTCTAEVGPRNESTYFTKNLAVGETKVVLPVTVSRNARDFGINTSDYRLPLDVNVGVTVNSNRTVEELNYQNNQLVHPVRITAPDLAVEVLAPRYTTPASTTTIGVRVTNLGEVESNAATLYYSITGKPDATIAVPALMPGASTMIWQNQTLVAGEYTVDAEVNRAGATDYETTFANNRVNATVGSYANPATRIDLPRDLVLVPGPNSTYDLPITVNQVSGLAAYQMDLTFNGSVLTVQDVIPGALSLTAKNIGNGRVQFNGAAVSGVSGNVTIATVRFNVVGVTGDETTLNLAAELWDENTLVIPVDAASGDAYLLLYGDANSDGVVNQADTLKVLREVVGLDAKPTAKTTKFLLTDVTRNSAVDVGDAMFIAQHNVGLRDDYFRIV